MIVIIFSLRNTAEYNVNLIWVKFHSTDHYRKKNQKKNNNNNNP